MGFYSFYAPKALSYFLQLWFQFFNLSKWCLGLCFALRNVQFDRRRCCYKGIIEWCILVCSASLGVAVVNAVRVCSWMFTFQARQRCFLGQRWFLKSWDRDHGSQGLWVVAGAEVIEGWRQLLSIVGIAATFSPTGYRYFDQNLVRVGENHRGPMKFSPIFSNETRSLTIISWGLLPFSYSVKLQSFSPNFDSQMNTAVCIMQRHGKDLRTWNLKFETPSLVGHWPKLQRYEPGCLVAYEAWAEFSCPTYIVRKNLESITVLNVNYLSWVDLLEYDFKKRYLTYKLVKLDLISSVLVIVHASDSPRSKKRLRTDNMNTMYIDVSPPFVPIQ